MDLSVITKMDELDELALQINEANESLFNKFHKSLDDICRVGDLLLDAKNEVKRRRMKWGEWIDEKLDITQRHANRYMKIALNKYQLLENRQECPNSNISPWDAIKQLSGGNGAHVSNNSGNNEWYTPYKYISAARKVMGEIDLDPASSETANQKIRAKIYFTSKDDGLKYEWDGRVWMNPPYARDLVGQFTEKLSKHYKANEVTEAVVLLNNATETEWEQELLNCCSAICLIKGRVKFIDMDGHPSGAPLQGQIIIYLGNNINLFNHYFAKFGKILYANRNEH